MTNQYDDVDDLEIRVLNEPADMRRLVVLFNQVWGTVTPIVGVELLRAIGHTGGYISGAFTQNRMVGGSLAFLGRHHDEVALHSHITGILPGVRQTGLGRQMKLHQRAWAAEQGLDWITWTFDPLVRRNAWFNIGVLGAQIDAYLVDFYGQMNDSLNGDDIIVLRRTDPAEASSWRLRVREELGTHLTNGGRVVGFTRDGEYLVLPASSTD